MRELNHSKIVGNFLEHRVRLLLLKVIPKEFYCKLYFLAFASLSVMGCFDYQETVTFAPDYSGFVDFEYDVPISANGSTLVGFLPTERKDIQGKYGKMFIGGTGDVENFSRELYQTDDSYFPKRAKVKYRVRFKKARELETLLIGKTTVIDRGRQLVIQRIFPVTETLTEESSRVVRRLQSLSNDVFARRTLKFYVNYPWYFDMATNYGTNTRPGSQAYILPIEQTLNSKNNIVWNISLKANPEPEDISRIDSRPPVHSAPFYSARSLSDKFPHL